MQKIHGLVLVGVLLQFGVTIMQSQGESQSPEETLFQEHCAVCHNNPATRAPGRASLHVMSPDIIVEALSSGIMKAQGSALSPV
jgi:hypothetical protein